MTKAKQQERTEALERLREWLKPGDTVYTILRHVSRSGMSRTIDVLGIDPTDRGRIHAYGWAVAKALGWRFDRDREGVKVGGCGMDMGFHLVYSLSATLFPNGFGCVGAGCPSNDHSNGDRDYTPHNSCKIGPDCEISCTCHDDSAWRDLERYPNGCSQCGCRRVEHWHRDGDYALRQRWL